MIRITSLVLLATSLVAFSSPLLPRTAAQVESDLNTVTTDAQSLDNAINNLVSAGFVGIGPLEQTTTALLSEIQTATTNAANTDQLDATDGAAVFSQVQALEPIILKTLTDLDNNKAQIQADNAVLPGILPFVVQQLSSLSIASKAYETHLIAIAPENLQPSASAIASTIDAAFATAIAVYAAD